MKRDAMSYYRRALESLRRDGQAFARQHPRIAGRLQLEDDQCQDPHVERLLEGVAFLTARVERKLDDDFPQLTDALTSVLYPHALAPVPSLAVVQVQPDLECSIGRDGITVPRGTSFVTRRVRDTPMRFRSTSTLVVQPLALRAVEAKGGEEREAGGILRLRLEATGEHAFGAMRCASLPLFLQGGSQAVHHVYDRLVTDLVSCRWLDPTRRTPTHELPAGEAINLRGFAADDAALPWPARSFEGFRLLQEYFAFPDKFMFVDLRLPAGLAGRSAVAELRFRRRLDVEPGALDDALKLFCVPVINLFEKLAEPIAYDPRVGDQRVVPDANRATELEVHSIREVLGVSADGDRTVAYAPFYALRHAHPAGPSAYWHATLRESPIPGDRGRDLFVSLVDEQFSPAELRERTVLVKTLCSNRDLPQRVRSWGGEDDFAAESVAGLRSVRAVRHPTASRRPPFDAQGIWRLVSQLALDRLSLVQEGPGFLRDLLRLYDFAGDAASAQQIDAIADVQCRPTTQRIKSSSGIGFAHGTIVELTVDRARTSAASPMLFGGVLARFLAAYSATNSFVQLVLRVTEGTASDAPQEVHRWPPRAGQQELL